MTDLWSDILSEGVLDYQAKPDNGGWREYTSIRSFGIHTMSVESGTTILWDCKDKLRIASSFLITYESFQDNIQAGDVVEVSPPVVGFSGHPPGIWLE